MSFYVWDTPEVAKFFNVGYSSKYHFYIPIDGTRNAVYKEDYSTSIGRIFIEQMKLLGIPEYKLHPKHGLIPANSKLFNEDSTKEQKEKQMKQQEIKKVFEVGGKCIIKNIDNKFYVYEEAAENFVDKEVTIVSKFTIPSNIEDSDINMVSVMNENGQCICFREEMCYPVKTHKEKTIDKIKEVCNYKGSWSSLYQQFASDLYDAGFRFKDCME